jgi:hypothetical protein
MFFMGLCSDELVMILADFCLTNKAVDFASVAR